MKSDKKWLYDVFTELEFPSSLTATERAYVHQMGVDFGFKHKSRG